MALLSADKVRYLENPENKTWLNFETDPDMRERSKRIEKCGRKHNTVIILK
jgi:hypothetical protein